MDSGCCLLPIQALRYSVKKRRGVSWRRVEELRQEIEMGEDIMPIRVCALGDGTYVIQDGRHRVQAHLAAGVLVILAIVANSKSMLENLLSWFFKKNCSDVSSELFTYLFKFATTSDGKFDYK